MNPNERKFEELMSKMTFDDKPDHRHRDKLEQELLAAFARRQWQQERQSRQTRGLENDYAKQTNEISSGGSGNSHRGNCKLGNVRRET